MRAVWRAELRGGAWDLSFCGEKGDARAALYGERCGFSGLAEGMRPWKGICAVGEGWRGRAGSGIGRVSYGHWLVRVPPELVLEVGAVRVPPLPMEGVALRSLPPDPTREVWLTAQQALPFLSSLTT